jgi:drug/metabolite transporter (DMT)-like permease
MVSGVVYAALSSLLIGGYLAAYKRYFTGYPDFLYLGIVEGAALCWYVAVALVLDPGAFSIPRGFDLRDTGLLAGVVALTVGSAVASIRALNVGDVSYVAPLSKLAPPVVLALEFVVLGVGISPVQAAGLCVVTAGVYVLNRTEGGIAAPFARLGRYRPAQLALLSALLIGVADVGKRLLLTAVSLSPATLVAVTLAGLTAGTLPLGVRRWGERPASPRAWGALLLAGLSLAAADHLTALALSVSPASVVIPVLSGQAVIAVLLGGELLDEAALGRRLVAALAVGAGIAMVALG